MGRISKYTAVTAPADSDVMVVVQGSVTKNVALSVLKTYMAGSSLKNNFAGTAPPAVGDDSVDGYAVGSVWIDTVAVPKEAYRCASAAVGAAVWLKTTLSLDELGTGALLDIEAAAAENNVLVGGSSPFAWIKKTLAEFKVILGLDALATKVATSPDPTGKAATFDAAGNLAVSDKDVADIGSGGEAADLTEPGPIGGTTPDTGVFTTVSAGVIRTTHADDANLSVAECRGGFVEVSAAKTMTLPTGVTGYNLILYSSGANVISLKPYSSEVIVLNGTALTAAHKISSLGLAGDCVSVIHNGTNWIVIGPSVWVDGGT